MPRIRDKSTSSTVVMTHGPFNATSGAWTQNVLTGTLHQIDTMTDEVIPQFHKRKANGEVFVNRMSKLEIKTSLTPANIVAWRTMSPTGGYRWDGYDSTLIPDPLEFKDRDWVKAEVQRCSALAITSAYAEVGLPDVDSLVTVMELPETLAFLWNPLSSAVQLTKRAMRYCNVLRNDHLRFETRMAKHLSRLAKGRKSNVPTLPKRSFRLGKLEATDLSSLWLSYRYGLMPLLYEVEDYWKAFKKQSGSPKRITARGTFRSSHSASEPPAVFGPSVSGDVHTRIGTMELEFSARAGVLYEPRLETTQSQFGLELNRVPSALWEGIPLSFVADWVLNMSDAINAVTASTRWNKCLAAWVVTTLKWTYVITRTMTATESGQSGVCTYRQEGVEKIRVPASMQDIRLKGRVTMNTKRYVDAFALIHQFLKSAK